MYRKYDYIMNEYQTNTRRPRHKARISIAILEKESKAIARSNDTESNIPQYSRISSKVMYATIEQTRKRKAKRREHFAKVR